MKERSEDSTSCTDGPARLASLNRHPASVNAPTSWPALLHVHPTVGLLWTELRKGPDYQLDSQKIILQETSRKLRKDGKKRVCERFSQETRNPPYLHPPPQTPKPALYPHLRPGTFHPHPGLGYGIWLGSSAPYS